MDNLNAKLSVFGKKVLLGISCVIFGFLTWYSMRFTYYVGEDYVHKILVKRDSVLVNLLVATVIICVLQLLLYEKKIIINEKLLNRVVWIAGGFVTAVSIAWAFISRTTPEGDQLIVCAAASMAQCGNWEMFTPGGYLFYYPQQLGLIACLELLFYLFGDFCYSVVYVLFGLLNGLTVVVGYAFLKETEFSAKTRMIYVIFISLCVPYFLYTPYIYGDIPSIFLCEVLFLSLAKWEHTGKYRYWIFVCTTAALAALVRKNSAIVICAAVIGLFLMAIEQKRCKHLLLIVLMILSVGLSLRGVEVMYEHRSGWPVEAGVPAELFIAMGMMDGENAPGRYNNYAKDVYQQVELDREAAKLVGKEKIQSRWLEMRNTSGELWRFYREKALTQWGVPLFEGLISNHNFKIEPSGFVLSIYEGNLHTRLEKFCNKYQFLIYVGCLLAILNIGKKRGIGWCIPLIAVVGGFLFSLLWEAQCRYVLPYYVFAVPYSAYGLTEGISLIVLKVRRRNKRKH